MTLRKIDEAGLAFLLAEYQSLREESAHARQAQQSTLTWSLAVIGAVFAGGLVFVSTIVSPTSLAPAMAVNFYALVFGVALPGYAYFAAVTYVGELARMERAGAYLRGLEKDLRLYQMFPRAPLRWETTLALEKYNDIKLKSPAIGAMGLYFGSFLVSLSAFWLGTSIYAGKTHQTSSALWGLAEVLSPLLAPLVTDVTTILSITVIAIIFLETVLFIITMAHILLRVRRRSSVTIVPPTAGA